GASHVRDDGLSYDSCVGHGRLRASIRQGYPQNDNATSSACVSEALLASPRPKNAFTAQALSWIRGTGPSWWIPPRTYMYSAAGLPPTPSGELRSRARSTSSRIRR